MTVSARQKQLVQQTLRQIAPLAETASALFYMRLFELDPSLRAVFTPDLQVQSRKLLSMIAYNRDGLEYSETLILSLTQLGRRFAENGLIPSDYETIGNALLWTLARGLGAAFTAEVREAWEVVYGLLSEVAIEASAPVTVEVAYRRAG